MIDLKLNTSYTLYNKGRGFAMNNRRWYDNHNETKEALALLEKLSDKEQATLSESLVGIVNEIKVFHRDESSESAPLSAITIGIERVMGLYQASNSRRWYDKSENMGFALKSMSTLPESDYKNIMDGLSISLSSYN